MTNDRPSSQVPHEPDYQRTTDGTWAKKKTQIPMPLKIIGMLFAVVLASVGYWQSQLKHDPTLSEEPFESIKNEQRLPAPDVQFTTREGKLGRLSDFKGKVVLVSFWAHWCTPCLVELPSFKILSNKFSDQGLVVLPINVDDKGSADEQIDNLWNAEKFPFATFYDPEKIAAKTFNVETLPANFVVDRKGRLVFASHGANDWSNDTSMDLFTSLLSEN